VLQKIIIRMTQRFCPTSFFFVLELARSSQLDPASVILRRPRTQASLRSLRKLGCVAALEGWTAEAVALRGSPRNQVYADCVNLSAPGLAPQGDGTKV